MLRLRGPVAFSIFLNGELLLLGECMSSSAGSFIGYGYAFDRGTIFPWDADPFTGDVEFWWRSVNAFNEMHDKQGNERKDFDGMDPRIVDEVFEHRKQWHERNPMPVEIKQFGDLGVFDEDKEFAIIVRGIGCNTPDDEDVELFDPSTESFALSCDQRFQVDDFLRRFGIEAKEQPSWMVCCYY